MKTSSVLILALAFQRIFITSSVLILALAFQRIFITSVGLSTHFYKLGVFDWAWEAPYNNSTWHNLNKCTTTGNSYASNALRILRRATSDFRVSTTHSNRDAVHKRTPSGAWFGKKIIGVDLVKIYRISADLVISGRRPEIARNRRKSTILAQIWECKSCRKSTIIYHISADSWGLVVKNKKNLWSSPWHS